MPIAPAVWEVEVGDRKFKAIAQAVVLRSCLKKSKQNKTKKVKTKGQEIQPKW
jgi:hypothetical protein